MPGYERLAPLAAGQTKMPTIDWDTYTTGYVELSRTSRVGIPRMFSQVAAGLFPAFLYDSLVHRENYTML